MCKSAKEGLPVEDNSSPPPPFPPWNFLRLGLLRLLVIIVMKEVGSVEGGGGRVDEDLRWKGGVTERRILPLSARVRGCLSSPGNILRGNVLV